MNVMFVCIFIVFSIAKVFSLAYFVFSAGLGSDLK